MKDVVSTQVANVGTITPASAGSATARRLQSRGAWTNRQAAARGSRFYSPDRSPRGVEQLPGAILADAATDAAVAEERPSGSQRTQEVTAGPLVGPFRRIAGERFYLEIEDDQVYLRHPRWSLLGIGDTEADAEQDLRTEAACLAEVLLEMPVETLDFDTLSLRDFVLRVL